MALGIRRFALLTALAAGVAVLGSATPGARGGDWPQWRGPNRDAKATDFKAPTKWPEALTKKWSVTVGDGVATPALADGKLYVFGREAGAEVLRCLNADTGKEVWKERYDTEFKGKGDTAYPGPRASPAVADGMVVTFGVNGTLTCRKITDGSKVWQAETGAVPRFHTSSSPLIADKFVIVQVGSENTGGINAYNLANGDLEWSWTDEGSSYSSPVLMADGKTKMVVAQTDKSIVAIGVSSGKKVWSTPFPLAGKGPPNYNASSPTVDGQTVYFAGIGRGVRAIKIEKKGDAFTTKDVLTNKDNSPLYNSPVIKNGFLYGLSNNDTLFCINLETGKTAWTHSTNGRRGYGNVVDAGSVLLAQTAGAGAKLLVIDPTSKEYTELAAYKVSDGEVYAYPIATGNRIYIKDSKTVTMWVVDEK